MTAFKAIITQLVKEIAGVYWTLIKIMVPTLIIVKGLELIGAIGWLAFILSPVMALVGLPDEMGLVWAAALLTNIYTGMAVYFDMASQNPLSLAQVSVLGTLLLIGHNLLVEGAIAKKSGVKWRVTLLVRIGGALLLGALLNLSYQTFGLLEQPAVMLWQPEAQDLNLISWALSQLQILGMILVIISALMTLLKILNLLGVEKLMHIMLDPLLRFIGVGKEAANTTVIGMTLGLAFGGGLLIQEAKAGHMTQKDILLSMCFLGLCHSLIEDTFLILMLGADLSAIL